MKILWSSTILIQLVFLTKLVHGQENLKNGTEPPLNQSPVPVVLEATERITVTFKIQPTEKSVQQSTISTKTFDEDATLSIENSTSIVPNSDNSTSIEPNPAETTISREDELTNITQTRIETTSETSLTETNEILNLNTTSSTMDSRMSSSEDSLVNNVTLGMHEEEVNQENKTYFPIAENPILKSTSPMVLSSTEGPPKSSSMDHQVSQTENPTQVAIAEIVNPTPKIDIQTQIILVSSVLGGVILLMILCVLALSFVIIRLKEQVERQRYRPAEESNPYISQINRSLGYDNTAFSESREMAEKRPDSRFEMERMGYDVYNGKRGVRDEDLTYIDNQRDPEGFVDLCQDEQSSIPEASPRDNIEDEENHSLPEN